MRRILVAGVCLERDLLSAGKGGSGERERGNGAKRVISSPTSCNSARAYAI